MSLAVGFWLGIDGPGVLHAPRLAAEALQRLAPGRMARVLEEAAGTDVELVDRLPTGPGAKVRLVQPLAVQAASLASAGSSR